MSDRIHGVAYLEFLRLLWVPDLWGLFFDEARASSRRELTSGEDYNLQVQFSFEQACSTSFFRSS